MKRFVQKLVPPRFGFVLLTIGVSTLTALGCSSHGADEMEVGRIQQRLGVTGWPAEAVVATNSIQIGDRADLAGDVAVVNRALGPVLASDAELTVGYDATLTGSARADTLFLWDRATITGSARYNFVQVRSGASIQGGGSSPLALPLPITLPTLPAITPGSANITLANMQQLTRAAGRYRDVLLNSGTPSTPTRLSLSGGLYELRSLTLQNDARLECAAECEVRVDGRVSVGSRAFVGPKPGVAGLGAGNVQVLVRGSNGTSGPLGTPPAVFFDSDSTLEAYVLAPNGTTRLGSRNTFRGKVATRDCAVGSDGDGQGRELPLIVGHPVDVTVREGQTANFAVTLGDPAGTTYRWQRNGIDVPGPSGGSASYTFVNAPLSASGSTFLVRVTNSAGSVLSNPATLTVIPCAASDTTCDGVDDDCDGVPDDDFGPMCSDPSAPVVEVLDCIDGQVTRQPCSNGNACDGDEGCATGACEPGVPPILDDGNACTIDACDPETGTSHTPAPAGTPCGDGQICDGAGLCISAEAEIVGVVLDPDGSPASGAQVDVRGEFTQTDSNGNFRYSRVPAGQRALLASVTASNWVGTASVNVPPMGTLEVVIQLAETEPDRPYLASYSALDLAEGQVHDGEFGVTYTTRNNALFQDSPPIYETLLDRIPTRLEQPTRRGPPSVVEHGTGHWAAWKEPLPDGLTGIYVKPLGWGPGGRPRLAHQSSGDLTDPVLHSYTGSDGEKRLLVVWGEGEGLKASRSTDAFGVEWSTPGTSQAFAGGVGAPAIVWRGSSVMVAFAVQNRIYVAPLDYEREPSPRFGALIPVLEYDSNDPADGLPDANELRPVLSGASNGTRQSLGFLLHDPYFGGSTVAVVHSDDGGGTWSAPAVVNEDPFGIDDAPGMAYYKGYLYVEYPLLNGAMLERSPDGFDWDVPRFWVAQDERLSYASGPTLVPSSYPTSPTAEPVVELMNTESEGAPDTAFKYVLISDSYDEGGYEAFRAATEAVAIAHRTVAPHAALQDRYKMYRIFVPSREAGAIVSPALANALPSDRFETPLHVDTAFGAEYVVGWTGHLNPNTKQTAYSPRAANSPSVDSGEDSGHPHTAYSKTWLRIQGYYAYAVVEALIPGFDPARDVIHAVHATRSSIEKDSQRPVVTGASEADSLTWFHEFGHAYASLWHEEDPYPVSTPGEELRPNLTYDSVLSGTHDWAHFFAFDSPFPDGRGNSILAPAAVVPLPPSLSDFWDPELVNGNSVVNAGLFVVRPSYPTEENPDVEPWPHGVQYASGYLCIMNHTGGTTRFCAVCNEETAKHILGAAFEHAAFHDDYRRVFAQFNYYPQRTPPLEVDGTVVPAEAITCNTTTCSADITPYLGSAAQHRLTFREQPVRASLDLAGLMVFNGNGAQIHLYPETDLSSIGAEAYLDRLTADLSAMSVTYVFSATPSP